MDRDAREGARPMTSPPVSASTSADEATVGSTHLSADLRTSLDVMRRVVSLLKVLRERSANAANVASSTKWGISEGE